MGHSSFDINDNSSWKILNMANVTDLSLTVAFNKITDPSTNYGHGRTELMILYVGKSPLNNTLLEQKHVEMLLVGTNKVRSSS